MLSKLKIASSFSCSVSAMATRSLVSSVSLLGAPLVIEVLGCSLRSGDAAAALRAPGGGGACCLSSSS